MMAAAQGMDDVRRPAGGGIMSNDSTPHASPSNGDADQAGSSFLPMKPPLTFECQVKRLVDRGLDLGSYGEAGARAVLSDINYYRLRGYWMTLERDNRFREGTTLQDVLDIVSFDEGYRDLVWRMIEPFEIKVRTSFAYHLSHAYGPAALDDATVFRDQWFYRHSKEEIDRAVERSKHDQVPCTVHNLEKYGAMPVWALVEILSLGTVSKLYGNLSDRKVAKAISADFGQKPLYLKSWLEHLTYIRNICAHHNRLYGRIMTKKPTLHDDVAERIDCEREYPTLVVLASLYRGRWAGEWNAHLGELDLLACEYPHVDLSAMGMPTDWRETLASINSRRSW